MSQTLLILREIMRKFKFVCQIWNFMVPDFIHLKKNVHTKKVAIVGLSKERPILDHHAKAHILDFMKSGGFRTDFTGEIRRISKDQLPGMVCLSNLINFTSRILFF